jgi:hypothetical protein
MGSGRGRWNVFADWLDWFTIPLIDPRLPMMLVTSWNEWSEDTAIEPAASAPATVWDRMPLGQRLRAEKTHFQGIPD